MIVFNKFKNNLKLYTIWYCKNINFHKSLKMGFELMFVIHDSNSGKETFKYIIDKKSCSNWL